MNKTDFQGQLILLRHGSSLWNDKNLFTGWVDVPLSPKGVDEALMAGKILASLPIDYVFTSALMRAQMTAALAMMRHLSGKVLSFMATENTDDYSCHSQQALSQLIPAYKAQELNERRYGRLQGENKEEMVRQFGKETVQLWRRSFDAAPPEGESLAMTKERTVPYFQKSIYPLIQAGKQVLIVAHGNSLRSIMMMLENLSKEQIMGCEIATGEVIIYKPHKDGWRRQNG